LRSSLFRSLRLKKKAIAAKKEKAEKKLAREMAVADHLKKQAIAKGTAKALARKAVVLETETARIKSEAAQKEAKETTGPAFQAEKSRLDVQMNAAVDKQQRDGLSKIQTEQNAKVQKAISDSGLTGDARTTLVNSLNAAKAKKIEADQKAMNTEVKDKVGAEFAKKLKDFIAKKRAAIAEETGKLIAAATEKASKLTDAEQESIKAAAAGKAARGMADYRAGKLKVELPNVKAIAKAQANDPMAGLTEKQKAAVETKVADAVTKALPGILETKVQAKMATATNQAVIGIKNELEKESQDSLKRNIAARTVNKSEKKRADITKSETDKAKVALDAKIKDKTTGEALVALKTKLMADLSTQLKPVAEAELKAQKMKQELAKAKLVAAQNGKAELGSALDAAREYPVA